MSRRTFLALSAAVVVAGCSGDSSSQPTTTPADEPASTTSHVPASTPPSSGSPVTATPTTAPVLSAPTLAVDPFVLGVASGDPDESSVVLWTRLIGELGEDPIDVRWELLDGGEVVSSGTVVAAPADGHAVHVVAQLDGPRQYRFSAGGYVSPLGHTQPSGERQEVRIASASCQHFENGFYAAHRDLAAWHPDLVLFVGDFIYEGASRPIADGRVRSHDGDEPRTLEAYRSRYAHYLRDADLQAARAECPWLVVWDDHEVDNNYAGLVPELPEESDAFHARRAAAYRAWWEHMPTRLPQPDPGTGALAIHRGLDYGALLRITALDGRQYRSDQACGSPILDTDPPCDEALDPARTMLGGEQEAWVADRFAASTATWNALAQQTVLTDFRLDNGAILNYDQWDGYAPARERLLATPPPNLVVISGDIHFAGVTRLGGRGVELVTTSISSAPNVDPALEPLIAGFGTVVAAELTHRGYTRHVVTAGSWTAEYRIVHDATDPASTVSTWRTFRIDAGDPTVHIEKDLVLAD